MKQNYQTLSSVRKNLAETGRLPINLQEYLIDSISKIEQGEPIDLAFTNTAPNIALKGKQSIQYRAAKKSRDAKITMAFSILKGTDWGRCSQLADIIRSVTARIKTGNFQPNNEVERLILRAVNTGVRLPIKARSIYSIVKSN